RRCRCRWRRRIPARGSTSSSRRTIISPSTAWSTRPATRSARCRTPRCRPTRSSRRSRRSTGVFTSGRGTSGRRSRRWRRARRRARRRPRSGPLPPVTVLKPLKGPGVELYENLASFCRQSYPSYQIVFGVEDPHDPAVAAVQRLRREFPEHDIVLAVGVGRGTNRKVANLEHMMPHARHDVLVMSDSDIRVRPDYLRPMVGPLADPAVGLTTCLYRGRGHFGLPSIIESLFINTDFVPNALVAQWVQPFRYAFG